MEEWNDEVGEFLGKIRAVARSVLETLGKKRKFADTSAAPRQGNRENPYVLNTLGSGGCLAVALFRLNIFQTKKAAMNALDAELFQCWSSGSADALPGIPQDHWHEEVVKAALLRKGYDLDKVDLSGVSLATELKKGQFLIDGVLNDSYETGSAEVWRTDPEDETSPRDNEDGWRHSIAVSDGWIREKEFSLRTKWLWLDEDNRADPDKGYLFKVHKVYRVLQRPSPARDAASASR